MKVEYKITIFTPTYNRAYIINNLYESLRRQTFNDFEWLVIDDGSSDETEQLFQTWMQEENNFPIRYIKQVNGGKCRAINRALDEAKGELFFTVDSDDYLLDDALEKVSKWEQSIVEKGKYCGIAGNIGTSAKETTNTYFPQDYYDGSLLDRYQESKSRYIVDGERALIFYTDVHRRYKYPEFEGEKFMTEAVVWNRIAHDGYKMRFFNDIIWIFEYMEDGLTKSGNKVFINNPQGYGLWLKEKADFLNISYKEKLKMYYTFTCDMLVTLDSKTIAKCIGTSEKIILLCKTVKKLYCKVKK